MEFQGDCDEYCKDDNEFVDDHDQNDEMRKEPNKVIRQFYYVKFKRNFRDPALEAKIDKLEIMLLTTEQAKGLILDQIESLEKRIAALEKETESHLKGMTMRPWLRQLLQENYPESVDEDPETALDPETEGPNIKERIEELVYELSHGNHKLAEQKRIHKELKCLQKRKEEIEHQVREVEARLSPPNRRGWRERSKFDIQRQMRDHTKKVEEYKQKQEQKKTGWKEEIRRAEEKLRFINQKQDKIHDRILRAQKKLDEQEGCYMGYTTLAKKVKELAAKKDLGALEHLTQIQVEGFFKRLERDKEFRASYLRSVCS